MMLAKVEANITLQAPQCHRRPPSVGPIMSPNTEWLTVIYHLCIAGSTQKIWGKALKRNAFKRKKWVCVCVCGGGGGGEGYVCVCMNACVHVCNGVCLRGNHQH